MYCFYVDGLCPTLLGVVPLGLWSYLFTVVANKVNHLVLEIQIFSNVKRWMTLREVLHLDFLPFLFLI
jgi:hypothetical protein